MAEKFLTLRQIIEARGISANTAYRLIRAGKLPPGERVGARSVRWRASVVEAAFEALNASRADRAPLPSPEATSSDHLQIAATWLASRAEPPRPVIPALQAMFGLTAAEACNVAAQAFELRAAR